MRKLVVLVGLLALVAGFAPAPAQADQDPVAHVVCNLTNNTIVTQRLITDNPSNFQLPGPCVPTGNCWACLALLFDVGFEYSEEILSPTAVASPGFFMFSLELGDDD